MVATGINPTGLVTFFKELIEVRERQPSAVEQWFSTHPLTEERIVETRQVIARIPESTLERLTVNSQSYESFKARLRDYRQPPKGVRAR